MPDGISFKIDGVDEIKSGLRQINRKLARKVVMDSLRKGANEISKAARMRAPVRTGRLRKAIKAKRSKLRTKPQQGLYGYFVAIDPGKKRDDANGAYYGNFVDRGHKTRGIPSRYVRGKEFMLRAYKDRAAIAAKLSIKLLERGVEVARREAGFK